MSSEKYIGMDVHQATISVAVMDSTGKVIMESILETKALDHSGVRAGLSASGTDPRRRYLIKDATADGKTKSGNSANDSAPLGRGFSRHSGSIVR